MKIVQEYLGRVAKFTGLETSLESGTCPKHKFDKLLEEDSSGACPLSSELLYDYFDAESEIFFNKGSIGFWFEIDSLVGSDAGIEKNFTLFFNDELPKETFIQFLVIASNNIRNLLDRWEGGRKFGGEGIEYITRYRRSFLEKAACDFSSASDGRMPRSYRHFITVSMEGSGDKEIKTLLKFKRKLKSKLKAEKLSPGECGGDDLIEIGRDILQMSLKEQVAPKYNILRPLSDQVVSCPVSSTIEDNAIKQQESGLVSKVFYPEEIPMSFSLSKMVNLLGDGDKQLPARFIISYMLANNLGASGTSDILSQGHRSISAASKSYTQNDLVAKEEASQWREVLALHKKGEVFLQESMMVMITAPDTDIEIAEESLKSLYNSYDWKLKSCDKIQRLASLAMLPMMQSSYFKSLKFFRLTKIALSGEVVAKLPLQGEWKGVPTSGSLLVGRRGQLFNFNPFYRIGGGGNYNVVMMAPSGSGKSFFLQEMVQSALSSDVAVFVMDIGGSYKNICKRMGGEMVRFNKGSNISLNPFASLSGSGARYAKALELMHAGLPQEQIAEITSLSIEKLKALELGLKSGASEIEGIELLEIKDKKDPTKIHFVTKDSIVYAKSMISAMCSVSGAAREEALIERAITEGVAEHGSNLDITKLSVVLGNLKSKSGEVIKDATLMADCLFPYTVGGIHGRFFKAGKAASFKEMMSVFELEELVNDEPLLAVVLQVVLMQITMQFLCGDRTRQFMLVVDEAWMILDYAAAFLERFARTVRKYGGSLVVCTQDLSSFSNECGTRKSQSSILESSTWKLILQQKPEGVEAFAKSKAYANYIGLISSIRKCSANKFSEVLINTDGATVVGRFAADPYTTAMFSTESQDYNFMLQQEREGACMHEACLKLAQKYGELPDVRL